MKTGITGRPSLMAALVIGAIGCTTDATMKAELRLAGTMQAFGQKADEFRAARRAAVKNRQQLMNEEQQDAARLSADTAQRLAVWKVIGDARRQEVYDALLAATKAAGDAWDALTKLQADQQKALADADTKVTLGSAQLQSALKGLTTLGTPPDLETQAKFYVDFILKTYAQVDRLRATAVNSASASSANTINDAARSTSIAADQRQSDTSLADSASTLAEKSDSRVRNSSEEHATVKPVVGAHKKTPSKENR